MIYWEQRHPTVCWGCTYRMCCVCMWLMCRRVLNLHTILDSCILTCSAVFSSSCTPWEHFSLFTSHTYRWRQFHTATLDCEDWDFLGLYLHNILIHILVFTLKFTCISLLCHNLMVPKMMMVTSIERTLHTVEREHWTLWMGEMAGHVRKVHAKPTKLHNFCDIAFYIWWWVTCTSKVEWVKMTNVADKWVFFTHTQINTND